jgi:hypothetical protein
MTFTNRLRIRVFVRRLRRNFELPPTFSLVMQDLQRDLLAPPVISAGPVVTQAN